MGRLLSVRLGAASDKPRLVAGLLCLQHAYRLSDAAVVARWVGNPSYQHLTGETFFQHRLPIDPSSLTRWRGRISDVRRGAPSVRATRRTSNGF
jgi:IS5 family transposase